MWIVWPQLVLTLQPVAAANSAPASELKLVPRQSCTVVPAAVIDTSASPTVVPDACAAASGAASVTPVPPAPPVPPVGPTPDSPATVTWWPARRPVTLATLTLVAPIAAAADNVVLRGRSRR